MDLLTDKLVTLAVFTVVEYDGIRVISGVEAFVVKCLTVLVFEQFLIGDNSEFVLEV